MSHYATVLAQHSQGISSLFKVQPALAKGWAGLKDAAVTNGALDVKTRELIALALGVGSHCEPCVAFHAHACVKYGATREEVTDMLSMCIMMGGGPSLMYASKALDAFDEFTAAANK